MTWPDSVQTVTLTVGPLYDAGGSLRRGVPLTARISAKRTILASGMVLATTVKTSTDETGTASLEVVASDSTGLDATGHTYRVTCPRVIDAPGIDVELLAAEPTVAAEALVAGTTVDGTVYYLGATAGAVLAHGLVDGVPSITVARSPWRLDGVDASYDNGDDPAGTPAWPVIGPTGAITLIDLETLGD